MAWYRHNAKWMFGVIRDKAGFYLFTGLWAIVFSVIFRQPILAACGATLAAGGIGLWKHVQWGWSLSLIALGLCLAFAGWVSFVGGASLLNIAILICIVWEVWDLLRLRSALRLAKHVASLGPYGQDD